MVFREPSQRERPHGRVIQGPFPGRWGLVGATAATLFIGAMLGMVALQTEHLVCDSAACTIDGKPAFSRGALHGAHSIVETGSKNSKHGIVVLELEGGDRRMMSVEPDEAEQAASAIRSACASGAPVDVELHGPRYLAIIALALIVASVVFAAIALANMGRVDFTVADGGETLLVRRCVLGIPFRSRRVPLARAQKVVVEHGTITPVMRGRGESLIDAARLHLVSADRDWPLTERFYPGHALHLRAAAALRAALELDPDPKNDAELASIPMVKTAMGQRVMFAWAGLTTGSLLGLAIFGLTGALFGIVSLRANIEGWMFAAGMIPGAIGGVAIVFHATRERLPR